MLSAVTEYDGGEVAMIKALNGAGKDVTRRESLHKYDPVGIGETLRKDLGIKVELELIQFIQAFCFQILYFLPSPLHFSLALVH